MAGKYTEAQAKATRKWQDKTVTIQIRVTEDEREWIRNKAQANGQSLNEYVKECLGIKKRA